MSLPGSRFRWRLVATLADGARARGSPGAVGRGPRGPEITGAEIKRRLPKPQGHLAGITKNRVRQQSAAASQTESSGVS